MRKLLLIITIFFTYSVYAQDEGYKLPPKDITDLLLAKPTPLVSIDSKANWMLLSDRNSYPSVEELAQPELRIAGLRIDPNNFAPSRQNFVNNIWLKNISTGKEYKIIVLPASMFIGNITWSPGDKKIAFTQTNDNRVDLYVVDVA